ncbi:MAG TPA: hypothetical protein VEU55_02795 [Gemmatimonadales bacterium]|nr:hypothetical protein [Gemmatimonadales bacterium]
MVRVLAMALVALSAACGTQSGRSTATAGDSLTERQRDSMLSTSGIPGARGVGAAMRVADSTSAGIRAADSVPP